MMLLAKVLVRESSHSCFDDWGFWHEKVETRHLPLITCASTQRNARCEIFDRQGQLTHLGAARFHIAVKCTRFLHGMSGG